MPNNYSTDIVTRIKEGASWEDIEDGYGYETVYLVYDEEGVLIWETTKYDRVKPYFENQL